MARIQLTEGLRTALLDPQNLPAELVIKGHVYRPQEPIKAGFKGAVWKVADEHGRLRAAKLAIYEDYENRSFLKELFLAAKLESYPQFARFVDAGILDITLPGLGSNRFVCFVEEWIEGLTLSDFLEQQREYIDS